MALTLPTGASTLPRPVPAAPGPAVPAASAPATPAAGSTHAPHLAGRVREVALSPVTALVSMLIGLALLFVVPFVGLPFVAVVVLPAVIYHLQLERRPRLRARR